jgi:hypothetical protein
VAKKALDDFKKSTRKCFNNHEMILAKGNHFIQDQDQMYQAMNFSCDFCQTSFSSEVDYYYCYFCTVVFCKGCDAEYVKINVKNMKLRCNLDNIPALKD